jgi:hypothetical protein
MRRMHTDRRQRMELLKKAVPALERLASRSLTMPLIPDETGLTLIEEAGRVPRGKMAKGIAEIMINSYQDITCV